MGDFYAVPCEMTHPRTSGLHFGDVSYEQLQALRPSLTKEEKAAPSARHYDDPPAPLPPEYQEALSAPPLRPEDCPMPAEMGKLFLTPGAITAENGYGVLPNGVGYAAVKVDQVGITDEMIRKYRDQFTFDGPPTLFYKVWFPGMHLLHYENGVAENFGFGMLNLEMNQEFFSFAHLGITREDIPRMDPDCLCLLGFYGRGWQIAHPEMPPIHTCMVQHTRRTKTGRELRVRFWSGMTFGPKGQLDLHTNPDQAETLAQMRCMMGHCMQEYQNELRLMKAFWAS